MTIEFTYLQNSLPAIICSFPFLPRILPRLLPNWMTLHCPNLPLPLAFHTGLYADGYPKCLGPFAFPCREVVVRIAAPKGKCPYLTNEILILPSETLKTHCLYFLSTYLSFYSFIYSFHNISWMQGDPGSVLGKGHLAGNTAWSSCWGACGHQGQEGSITMKCNGC